VVPVPNFANAFNLSNADVKFVEQSDFIELMPKRRCVNVFIITRLFTNIVVIFIILLAIVAELVLLVSVD